MANQVTKTTTVFVDGILIIGSKEEPMERKTLVKSFEINMQLISLLVYMYH
jgi:hypothetical protein